MHTFNDAGGNVTWDLGEENLLRLFQPGSALSRLPFFTGRVRTVGSPVQTSLPSSGVFGLRFV